MTVLRHNVGPARVSVREYESGAVNYRQHSFYFGKARRGTYKLVLNWPKATVTLSYRATSIDDWRVIDFWRVKR